MVRERAALPPSFPGAAPRFRQGLLPGLFLGLLLLLAPGVLTGVGAEALEAQTGTLQGRVTAADTGGPLLGAIVGVRTPEGLIVAQRQTNRDGFWSADVPAGNYEVTVRSIGYEEGGATGLVVRVGEVTRADLVLQVRAVALAGFDVLTGTRGVEDPSRAEAAVGVISREQLSARPATTPVDHLRSLAQVDVIQQGVQSTNVVARGFNNIFSGALHTLTDYRMAGVPSLRVNVMSFVPSTEEDLERMELVFGPAAALYGPNTANGVLHIMTRSPLGDPSTSVSVMGGERSLFGANVRSSHLLGENLGVKVSAHFLQAEEWAFQDPVEASERDRFDQALEVWREDMVRAVDITEAEADRRIARIGDRDYDISRWSVDARADWALSDDATAYFSVGRSNAGSQIEMTGLGAAQARDWSYTYYQTRFERGQLFAQLYLNQSDAGDTYLLRNGAPIVDRSKLWVGQIRHGTELGTRNTLLYGVDFAYTDPETEETINGIYEDEDETTEVGAYLQTRTRLSPALDLVLAGRVDSHSALPDAVFSPRVGLVYNPRSGQTFRASFNRAFSTPSSLNQFLDLGTAVPNDNLALLGYSVRVQGTGTEGFRFRQSDGSYLMRSPFGDEPRALRNTEMTPEIWSGMVRRLQFLSGGQIPQELAAVMEAFGPTSQDIGVLHLMPGATQPGTLESLDLPDVEPIRESLQSTFEVGYRGVIDNRLAIQADVWYSRRSQLVTPLTVQTPLIIMNPTDLQAFMLPRLTQVFMAQGMPEEQAQATAAGLTAQFAQVPVGVISSADVNANGAQLLSTYTNVDDDFDVWGVDLGGEFFLDDSWSLRGSLAFVNDDHFTTSRGEIVTLNAPRQKGSVAVAYRNQGLGLGTELRARFAAGFPASSGVYEGTACLPSAPQNAAPCVDSSTLLDLNLSYQLPNMAGASMQLSIQNLLDESFQSFPGTPAVGRMAILRLRYEL